MMGGWKVGALLAEPGNLAYNTVQVPGSGARGAPAHENQYHGRPWADLSFRVAHGAVRHAFARKLSS